VVGHVAEVELGAETEALVSVREGAALSHWSAATMWGLWTPGPRVVEVLLNDAPAAVNPGVRVHRSRILEARDLHIRRDLPVTSPARTLLDIAPTASDRQLELAFDRAPRGKMRPSQVADVLDRAGGHPGRRRLATMLERESVGTTMTRSVAEERRLALMRAAHLPGPLVNADVGGYELDFYWPDHKFAVEVDSWRFHSGRRAFEDDRQKDQGLRRLGIDPTRTTGSQLKHQPYAVVAGVATGLAWAAARTGADGGGAGTGEPGPGR
jgi:very-short-patch-repair endonuclease